MIWAGDSFTIITFSGTETKTRTYSQNEATQAANNLIDLLGEFGMEMMLKKGTQCYSTGDPKTTQDMTTSLEQKTL